jgi:hypothetical protein
MVVSVFAGDGENWPDSRTWGGDKSEMSRRPTVVVGGCGGVWWLVVVAEWRRWLLGV